MADQDFNIRIVTTADTSGIRETEAGLARLAGGGPIRGGFAQPFLAPIPKELLEPTEAFAKSAGEAEKLAGSLIPVGANLTRARQEALVLVRELETGGNVTRTLGSLLGSLGTGITFAALGGIAIAEAFKSAAEQANRIHKAVSDQVTELDKAAAGWDRAARSATTVEDVSRAAAATLPILNQIAAKNKDIQVEQTSATQKFIELFAVGFQPLAGITGNIWKPFTDGLKAAQTEQQQLRESAQGTAAAEVRAAEASAAAWNVTRVEDFSQAVKEVGGQMKAFRDYQASIDLTPGPGFEARMTDYKITGERISDLEKQLQGISAIEKEREEAHKLLFPDLDDQLYKIQRIRDELHSMGIQTDNLNKAFSQGLDIVGPLGEKIRQLVLNLLQAQNAASKTLTSDLFKGTQTAFQDSLKRQQDFAAHVAAQRELAAEGVGEEVSAAEKKKFFAEDELRQLQRKQALQRSLLPENADQAELVKRLGTQGAKDFEERSERIRQLTAEISSGRSTGGAGPRTVAEWRAQREKETEEFNKTHGPEAIAKWRERQQKAMEEYRGTTAAPSLPPPGLQAPPTQAQPQPETTAAVVTAIKDVGGWLQKLYQIWQ